MEDVEQVVDQTQDDQKLGLDFLGFDEESINYALTYTETFKSILESTSNFDAAPETKSEYAQYLGLQPTIKFRCIKCQISNFQTLESLNMHLINCKSNFETTITPVVTSKPQTNFKITRRVYLCSACGVYFEIWKLFLHMRTAHRRYICLVCLGLFSVAEKLSNHLSLKHQIHPKNYLNLEGFLGDYATGERNQFYVMCCHCEQMFTEKEDFSNHACELGNDVTDIVEKSLVNGGEVHHMEEERVMVNGDSDETIKETNGDKVEVKENSDDVMEADDSFKSEEEKEQLPTEIEEPQKPMEEPPELTLKPPEPIEPESSTNHPEPDLEVRKVPKVTLKLPPPHTVHSTSETDSETDDSLKLTMDDRENERTPSFPIADPTIPIIEMGLRPPLIDTPTQKLLKDFIRATCWTCVYCNYARKIAVNGKQLGLHMIAEHRFSAIADSITEEELLPDTFVKFIEANLPELDQMYFNLESYDSTDPDSMIPYDRTYECFQCRFVTTVHKELYLHNRKMHQKTLLLCIMCKSTFYSYSELLCHLCAGVYLNSVVTFRCCLCPTINIPSAFRLMVHLRKAHHACDVCLETCTSQSKLSNHVWKHKLHHLCYRCGIAYRNKPDITKHLFWKHGTESVLCKKCLQKKWPHVYHFCIPPLEFMCDECTATFTKAVALRVHKRIHRGVKPYKCTEEGCEEMFISKKLVEKHVLAHQGGGESMELEEEIEEEKAPILEENVTIDEEKVAETPQETVEEPKPKVVDVYDIPALNLSESDSSDTDEEPTPPTEVTQEPIPPTEVTQEPTPPTEVTQEPIPPPTVEQPPEEPPIVDGIWENFKNYQASQVPEDPYEALREVIKNDHDYCALEVEPAPIVPEETEAPVPVEANPDSSSDSDSSSCSCGSNCSCSTSSGSSSSSSSSDSDEEPKQEEPAPPPPPPPQRRVQEIIILESDLYTDESETDEEFYDKAPHQPKKLEVAPLEAPPLEMPPVVELVQQVKRKSKKRKKAKKILEVPKIEPPVIETSGSETDLRLSKRRRVPNKFYGYSSDDDAPHPIQLPQRPMVIKPPEPPQLEWNVEDLPEEPPKPAPPPLPVVIIPSPKSSDSDDNRLHISHPPPPPPVPIVPKMMLHPQPRTNLYCYCQCPYDEVSEMIACDGKKCAIEWFHFECVGIMVPPKGKWFCPDCRKQTNMMGLTQRPEYFMSQ